MAQDKVDLRVTVSGILKNVSVDDVARIKATGWEAILGQMRSSGIPIICRIEVMASSGQNNLPKRGKGRPRR